MISSIPATRRVAAQPTSFKAGEEAPMRLLSLKEFAHFVGISYGQATRLGRKGKLKKLGKRVGVQWRFYPTNLRAYFETL